MTGVGNLFITAGRIGYSHLCRGPQKKINNVVDSKRNYFFNWKSSARIHLKTVNKLSWTYLLQQRGPHIKPWRSRCGPRVVVWAALDYDNILLCHCYCTPHREVTNVCGPMAEWWQQRESAELEENPAPVLPRPQRISLDVIQDWSWVSTVRS
jgi:hypothetical protein